jgi:hypothetical protein
MVNTENKQTVKEKNSQWATVLAASVAGVLLQIPHEEFSKVPLGPQMQYPALLHRCCFMPAIIFVQSAWRNTW